jgi:hypothetical protein
MPPAEPTPWNDRGICTEAATRLLRTQLVGRHMHICAQSMHVSPLSLPPLPFSLSLLILFLAQPRPAYHPKYSISCTDRLPRRICHGNVKPVNSKIASPDSSIAAVAAPSRRPGPWDHITPISLSATLSALVHIVSG